MEQNTSEIGGMINIDNVDDDIVVDALEPEQKDVKDKEFVLPGGQIIGLDQAVLQSIERCRKFHLAKQIIGFQNNLDLKYLNFHHFL